MKEMDRKDIRDDNAPMLAPTRKDPTKLMVKSNAPQTNVDTTRGLFDDAALLRTLRKPKLHV